MGTEGRGHSCFFAWKRSGRGISAVVRRLSFSVVGVSQISRAIPGEEGEGSTKHPSGSGGGGRLFCMENN